jgi:hypothetical protein
MSLHLSNAKLFGLLSAISNAELIGSSLSAECGDDTGCTFKLILCKKNNAADSREKELSIYTASNIKEI